MTREKYIIEQENLKESEKEKIDITLDPEQYEQIVKAANIKDISIGDFIVVAIIEEIIRIEKERYSKDYKNIIDIYDLQNLEEYMDEVDDYLVISPNGKHVILIPHKSETFKCF